MKKLKVYLDTSVISHLDAQDMPLHMKDTLKLWEDFIDDKYDIVIDDKYDIVISDLVMTEISHCPEPKRTFLYSKLAKVKYEEVKQNITSEVLAKLYSKEGGLPPSSVNDAKHIAIATISSCNIIVSWNFNHIVNLRAMTAVDSVNLKEGYHLLRILSPSMLINQEGTK
jgi:predicted nucleic acid-binding protein